MYGPFVGGAIITNPYAASDQGIATVEPLFVNIAGPADVRAGGTTFAVQPGASFIIAPGTAANVSVNAATSGHRFSAVAIHETANFVPFSGLFPPEVPTVVTKVIPAVLYQEYNDDDDLQAFFKAFNDLAQEDIDWFVNIGLPIYTGLSGNLLDFVAAGLYGLYRPALPFGKNANEGPLNTWALNTFTLNTIKKVGNQQYYATTDDVFKRILTWLFFKGDGKVFTVRWLKRRIVRFLEGVDGVSFNVDQTYRVSVTFGNGNQVNITLSNGKRTVLGGAFPNGFALNTTSLNALRTSFTQYPAIPLAATLKAGIDSGVLELPFQYTYVVNIT